MKKTLIALVALSGLALADSITLTNPSQDSFTWIPGSEGSGITLTMTAANVSGIISAIPAGTSLTGWFGGTGQGYDAQSQWADEVIITGTDSFTFCSRPALKGEYVMMGIALPKKASSITLSFTADKYVGYALFAYDGENVTEIMPKAVTNADKTSGATIDVTQDTTVAPSALFVLWSSKPDDATSVGGGQAITVSGIEVAYTPAPVVPEPATATLSLLALAGLAARRRRH